MKRHRHHAAPARPALVPYLLVLAVLSTAVAAALALGGCGKRADALDPDAFLAEYNARYRELWRAAEGARWDSNTDIGDSNTARRIAAEQAFAAGTAGSDLIEQLRALRSRDVLTDLQRRQLGAAWRIAAHHPGTLPETVDALIRAEAAQNDALYGFEFQLALPGRPPRAITPNDLDGLMAAARDLDERQAIWECGKSIGPELQDGLAELQRRRNEVARAMGFSSFFGLEVADYGMSSAEMMALMDELLAGLRPLYEQLHCWARHELARRYGQPVPRRLPAHWLDNRWAQEWPGLVEGVDLDGLVAGREPAWLIEQAERFYVSLGLPALPATFWERSDLYELPAGAPRKKNTHASAWHIDLDQDVRSLMSVKSTYGWFTTTHHELGHVYYFLAYSNPEVPFVLRTGANRAFHEAIGTLIELASSQVPYLEQIGLLAPRQRPDEIRWLLSQALHGPVVFLPFACGTMTHFEHDLYERDLPPDAWQQRWWEYAARYQGIEPPAGRRGPACDPLTKTHISDDPAQYYDYALSSVILHQLHDHISREILDRDPRAASYYGNRDVGAYLSSIMTPGATRDWRRLLEDVTGEPLSSRALLEYFAPLRQWLMEQNAGRDVRFD